MNINFNVVISAATFAVVGCAVLAAWGFRGRPDTVGIDLGTTFSVVAVRERGQVRVVEDEWGGVLTPSVVSFLSPEERKPSDESGVLVGRAAVERLSTHSQSTIFNAKRFIGRRWGEEALLEYAESHPFKIVPCDESTSNFSAVAFSIPQGQRDLLVSPEQIGTHVLTHLRALTAQFLGHEQVKKAVIAVPAKFTSLQRAATGAAFKAAGLKVVRVVEEPTAAAVAYKLHTKSHVHHILVYDFGGGTLDVSILYVAKGSVSVYATDGDDDLGGSDFDLCLFDALTTQLENTEVSGHQTKDILDEHLERSGGDEVEVTLGGLNISVLDLCYPPTIRQKSEDIKKQLSWNTSVVFSCDALFVSDEQAIVRKKVSFEVTRDFFESKCESLFQRSLVPISRLIEDLNMQKEDIDEVVLVGGTTRIPRVKYQLRKYFNNMELNDRIDPDITVAYGAASILD